MKTRFSNPNLRNVFPEQEEPREPVDEQPQASGGSEEAEQYQNIQHPSRQEASQTSGGPANASPSVDELEQGPCASAPQSPTEFYDALEETNAEQQSHSETGDTDFITPEQSPTKLASVPVQRQQQQQQENAHSDNDTQEPSSSHPELQIRVQPPSPYVVTRPSADSDDEADSEADHEQAVSLPRPAELQADPQPLDNPAASPASPQVETEHHAITPSLRLLLEPLKTREPAVMSQRNNNNSSMTGQGQMMSTPVDSNHRADDQTHATAASSSSSSSANPQLSLTEEQVRAMMMEDDDFDPIPVEYRQQPTSQYVPQATQSTIPQYTQAYNTAAYHQAEPQYMGMATPYQYGYPPQGYVAAPYGYGFPQPYAGVNNPLFADPRLAYTPPVGPRAQMAGHLNTPPVGLPAQLARPDGVLPYAQSPGGRVGVGGTPSPNRQGQGTNAGGRMDTEDGDEDIVGGVSLRGNGGNN
ncbi:hypothetical protein LTS07_000347 [Exophiala sideris]|uniref:Uncharacterized protein n=1 Tax=Exophiala sideris TaxID=1016849 RepID=A0ABR0JQI4_9EURO|nr:hypothetical protein LTS07_000347 [Exophiala sideris]KAK5041404.1 hypothetical protein LTR13_002879 [Exophiala sideris]KAK5068231.1 hypothetical protein LTR69_000349 [Exophiala sideris]KAK5187532.1 hypothetical protein LTR44_000348 [Eurotiomycetes sp. CCFEE 6388]